MTTLTDEEKEYIENNRYEDREFVISLQPNTWEKLENLADSYDIELDSLIGMILNCEVDKGSLDD